MAPAASTADEINALTQYFTSCGLSSVRATELCANPKQAKPAAVLFRAHHLETVGLNDKQASLVVQVSKDGGKIGEQEKDYTVRAIVEGRIKSGEQVLGMLRSFRFPLGCQAD